MAAKMRHCWFCGEEIGVCEDRDHDRRDTCGKRECQREANEDERGERDDAHRELDERMGW